VSARLYVGNLPYNTTERELQDLFGPAASKAKIIIDRETGQSKGFGFLEYDGDLNAVLAEFDGIDFGGRTLRVREADPRPPRNDDRRERH